MIGRVLHPQQDEGDQRDARHAVGLKAVGGRPHRIARVVSRAVRDHARVARVVLLDLEDDFHEVGADVRNLGEDAAGDAQGRRAQRLANGEADEARPGIVSRNEEQDDEHHQELDADEHHADAHAGPDGNLVNGKRLAAQAGKRRAGVRKGVHADAEPRHPVTAGNPDHTEQQDDGYAQGLVFEQHAEVEHDDDGDEDPEQEQEFALLDQVGLAGLPDQLGDLCHGTVDGKVFQAAVNNQSKEQPKDAEQNAEHQAGVATDAEELDLREVGKLQIGLAGSSLGRLGQSSGRPQQGQGDACRQGLCDSASTRPGTRQPSLHWPPIGLRDIRFQLQIPSGEDRRDD